MHPLVQRERLADVRGARAHLHTSCDVGASAPHTPERVARTSDGTMFRVTSGWARGPRHRIATRACVGSTDFHTYACGGFEDGAKIPKYSDEWCLSPPHRVAELVRKASTHRYLSFDPMTEHIASEMRLILCSDNGKAGLLYQACRDLPSAACPYVSWCTAGVCSHAGLVDAARHDVLLVTVGGSLRSSLGRAGRVPDSTLGALHARAHECRCRQQHSAQCDRRRGSDGAAAPGRLRAEWRVMVLSDPR